MRAKEFLKEGINNPSRVYLLKGTDGYLKREVIKAMQKLVPSYMQDLGIDEYDDGTAIAEIVEAMYTVSMFGGQRVVYLNRTKAMSEADKKLLEGYVKSPSDSTILIIEDKAQYYTYIAKHCEVIDCSAVSDDEAGYFIEEVLGQEAKAIKGKVLSKLCAYCGKDMGRIITEAKKLISYAGKGQPLSEDDVENLVVADTDYKMYELASAFTDGNNAKALQILSNLKSKGESPARLIYNITIAYRKLFHLALSDLDDNSIASVLGMSPKAVAFNRKMIAENKKKISGYIVKLKAQLEYLYDLEYKFKSGIITDENALNMAVAKLLVANTR